MNRIGEYIGRLDGPACESPRRVVLRALAVAAYCRRRGLFDRLPALAASFAAVQRAARRLVGFDAWPDDDDWINRSPPVVALAGAARRFLDDCRAACRRP